MTKEEKKEIARVRARKWYEEHKEYALQRNRIYMQTHREIHKKANNKYKKVHKDRIDAYKLTKEHRATRQMVAYKTSDLRYERGVSTITQKWIIENVYTSKCFYCGCDDWRKLGCDRIENDKPHTPDNVVVSCYKCNTKRRTKDFKTFCKIMGVE